MEEVKWGWSLGEIQPEYNYLEISGAWMKKQNISIPLHIAWSKRLELLQDFCAFLQQSDVGYDFPWEKIGINSRHFWWGDNPQRSLQMWAEALLVTG